MSEYLLINILIAAVPLIMSFEKNLKFYKNFPPLLLSILSVGSIFVIWDEYATIRGDWSFNSEYLLGINFFSLPLEELLFFITVPYSIIFLFETAHYYLRDKKLTANKLFIYLCILILTSSSFLFKDQYYTFSVLIFAAISLILLLISATQLLSSRIFWLFILFTYIPFFIVNYFLTSLPIVEYSPNAIWGIRLITIPIEDFFYSFSLISLYLIFYTSFKKIFSK